MRIAEGVYNTSRSVDGLSEKERYLQNVLENLGDEPATTSSTDTLASLGDQGTGMSEQESKVLDKVGEALARLGRAKRVGLTVRDKVDFVEAWSKKRS